MRAFCLVADLQSFSSAASEMGISTTMVSRYVKQLEQHLGCLLLKRNTRKVFLTPAGDQYRAHIKPLLKKLTLVENQMSHLSDAPSGKLAVSTTLELGAQYFAPLIAQYRQAYPQVLLDINLSNSPIDLFDTDVDLAFRVAPALPNASHIAQSVANSKLSLWVSPQYLAVNGTPTTIAELAEHQLMFFAHNIRKEQWLFEYQGQRQTIKLPWAWTSNNGRLLNEAAASGQGIIQAPSYSVNQYVEQGDLIELMPEYSIKELSISAVYPHRYQLSNRVSSFVEMAKKYFKDNPLP